MGSDEAHEDIPAASAEENENEELKNQAAEETQSTRADDCIPAAEEIARQPLVLRLKKLSGQLKLLPLSLK